MAEEVIHQNPEVTDEFSRATELESVYDIRVFPSELTHEEMMQIHKQHAIIEYMEKWWLETLQLLGIPKNIFEVKENQ